MGKQKEVILTAKKGEQVETAIFDVSGSKWVNGFSFCVGGASGGLLTMVFVFSLLIFQSFSPIFIFIFLFFFFFSQGTNNGPLHQTRKEILNDEK